MHGFFEAAGASLGVFALLSAWRVRREPCFVLSERAAFYGSYFFRWGTPAQ